MLKKEDHVTQWKLKPRWHVHGPYHSSIRNSGAQKTGESILLKGGRPVKAFALRARLNHLNVVHITCRANTTKMFEKTSAISPESFRTVIFVRQSGTWVFAREVGLDDAKDLMGLVFLDNFDVNLQLVHAGDPKQLRPITNKWQPTFQELVCTRQKTFPDQRNERNWPVFRNQLMVGF